MNEKEITNIIKGDEALKAQDRLWNDIEDKIKTGENTTIVNIKKKNNIFFRYGIASSCLAVILLFVLISSNLNKPPVNITDNPQVTNSQNDINQSPAIVHGGSPAMGASNGPAMGTNGPISNGPAMFNYYRYNGKYYKAEYPTSGTDDQISKDFKDIQNKIIKNLGDNFYEISGIDPSKGIAYFNGRYYYKLDYAFEDSVTLNNKPYLINANEIPDPVTDSKTGKTMYTVGEYLGKADSFDAYALPGFDPSEKIALKFNNIDVYCIAYQLVSSVTLNGAAYEVQPEMNAVPNDENSRYIGKAGPYNAYAIDNVDPAQSIIIHIDDNKETTANVIAKHADENIPESQSGSPVESMYPIISNIQWDHKIYEVSSYDFMGNQKAFSEQIGSQLGSYTFKFPSDSDNITYGLYEIKGIDNSKSIAIKNNKVYVRYDYLLDSIVKFNGKEYEISVFGGNGIRGDKIGMSGSNEVFKIKGIDPSEEIVVLIDGTTWTAYRVK